MRNSSLLLLLLVAGTPLAAQQAPVVTLPEAIRLAERVQPTIIQAQGGIRDASSQVRTAWGAFLPTVSATSSYGSSFSEGPSRINPVTNEIVTGNTSTSSVSMGLSANVDLFTGFRRGADLRAARARTDAAEAGLVDARFQLALTTTQEFLAALSAAELVKVRQASVRRAEEQLNVSVAKLRSGSATRSDSLRSLVTLGNARLQLINTETQLATAEANLARLIGAPSRVAAADDSSFYRVAVTLDTARIWADAERNAPRVQNADASALAARAGLSAARAAYWPSLNLSGRYTFNGSSPTDYELFNSRSVSLSLSWPLFNGFAREQTIDVRASALATADATAEDARRQVSAALTARLAELDAARVRIEIARTSVQAATEDLRVQQERYRVGVSTIVDVLTSQESLNQAEVDVVNARFDYLRAKAQIEALIGRSL